MMRFLAGLLTVILAALFVTSCSKEPEATSTPTGASGPLVIKVDGMQKGDGGKT